MLQYLVILLDNKSVSYCYHSTSAHKERKLMPLETLKAGILFAMKENLNIQFVYPDYELPEDYLSTIDTIDHIDIAPCGCGKKDVVVTDKLSDGMEGGINVVLKTTLQDLTDNLIDTKKLLHRIPRLNLLVSDIYSQDDKGFNRYKESLESLADELAEIYLYGGRTQLNVLTDRLSLSEMHNCGAGDSNLTLAPNGRFYVCPAFYYDSPEESVGSIDSGVDIKNPQLYKLSHAPLCRWCDAYHCRRCIWLNLKQTMDVNTPSHQQCVAAHIERNASRRLLLKLREYGMGKDFTDIKEIDYLDPLNKLEQWKLEKMLGR